MRLVEELVLVALSDEVFHADAGQATARPIANRPCATKVPVVGRLRKLLIQSKDGATRRLLIGQIGLYSTPNSNSNGLAPLLVL